MEVVFRPESRMVLDALAQGCFGSWSSLEQRLAAEREALSQGFDRLRCLAGLNLQLYDHQREAVLRVLREMRGRALLADEVGLGKTIEAGIIAKEYMVRGLVRKVLILAPASLLTQWQQELQEKLAIPARINRSEHHWDRWDCIISSLDTARRPAHAARVRSVAWDLVIVDEAHRLKNRHTAGWRLVDGLQKKYLLLLTATPIHNDLTELYSLFTLLKPGLLRTYAAFQREFMLDRRAVKQPGRLRERLAEVMVRSTRRDALLRLPRRHVETVAVPLTETERDFYRRVLAFARAVHAAAQGEHGHLLPLILLLRELCSSPAAAGRTLRALAASPRLGPAHQEQARELARQAAAMAAHSAKLTAAAQWIQASAEPVLVFTEFRATQAALARFLGPVGVPVTVFHGGLSPSERQSAVARFRKTGGALISTEAGGEGQNLQFCRIVLNYDLPWNPMRVEQRIGRVHRLGQAADEVYIYNLCAEQTIEEYILWLMDEKINLFRQVIGELDVILRQLERKRGIETRIAEIALTSRDHEDMRRRFEYLGNELVSYARRAQPMRQALALRD